MKASTFIQNTIDRIEHNSMEDPTDGEWTAIGLLAIADVLDSRLDRLNELVGRGKLQTSRAAIREVLDSLNTVARALNKTEQ